MKIGYVMVGLVLILAGAIVLTSGLPLSLTGNTVNVYVKEGNTPVQGATVKLIGSDTYLGKSGPLGLASITGVAAGEYILKVNTDDGQGYMDNIKVSSTMRINVDLGGSTVPTPSTEGVINGYVLSAATEFYIGGAKVTIGTYTDTTDSNGAFSISLPGGSYQVSASKNGYTSDIKDVSVAANGITQVNLLVKDAAVGYEMLVLQQTPNANAGIGSPVSGVALSLSNGVKATSNSEGRIVIGTLAVGDYSFSLNKEGYQSLTSTLSVTSTVAYQTSTQWLYLVGDNDHDGLVDVVVDETEYGTLSGTATITDSGLPITGANIVISSGTAQFTAITGADGSYSIEIPVGTYTVTATADGFSSFSGSVALTVDGATQDISLTPDDPDPYPDPEQEQVGTAAMYIGILLFVIGGLLVYLGVRRG